MGLNLMASALSSLHTLFCILLLSSTFTKSIASIITGPSKPQAPEIFNIRPTSFSLRWPLPINGTEFKTHRITQYDIELSNSDNQGLVCSDEYDVYQTIRPTNNKNVNEVTIEELTPNSNYCIRLIALSNGGVSLPSSSVIITTLELPMNAWSHVNVRWNKQDLSRGNGKGVLNSPLDDTFNTPTLKQHSVPTPRKGSSMNLLKDKVYLFGGISSGIPCGNSGASHTTDSGDSAGGVANVECNREDGVVNDLWRLDVVTGVWEMLNENTHRAAAALVITPPSGREGHSASVLPENRMLVFGGSTLLDVGDDDGSGTTTFLNDLWELDVGRTSEHVIEGSSSASITFPEVLEEGKIHRFNVDANIASSTVGGSVSEGDLCVKSIEVEVDITHACMQELKIALLGPGPRTTSANYKPTNRGERSLLWQDSVFDSECKADFRNTIFSDADSEDSILANYVTAPFTGRFKPLDVLNSKFVGSSVNGGWTLEVYDGDVNGVAGSLNDFKIKVNVGSCEEKIVWTDRSGGGGPSARSRHTSIVIGSSLYIKGGYNGAHLTDLWRYDSLPPSWVQLNAQAQPLRPLYIGRALTMTPHGILAFGGLNSDAEWGFEGRVWQYDVVLESWSVLGDTLGNYKEGNGGVEPFNLRESRGGNIGFYPELSEDAPLPSYGSSVALIGMSGVDRIVLGEASVPQVLHFGGDEGLARNTYAGELRSLKLHALSSQSASDVAEIKRRGECDWRLKAGGTADLLFQGTCGVGGGLGSGACRMEEILVRAWCLEEYQSFGNLF